MSASTPAVSVVIPSWNAKDEIKACLDSLLAQSLPARIIVVENGSKDGSLEYLQRCYPQIEIIIHSRNKGFAGGVNAGIRRSLSDGDDYVALFNNDAVAEKNWLKELVAVMESHPKVGISTCKFADIKRERLDSTGDIYTNWGLPFPRGRGEAIGNKYDKDVEIFGASGGASIYRVKMLKEIGIFDEDFFAYYEDIDISFRAQLAGWKVRFTPSAIAYHQIGATSVKIRGFTTYQTMKNLPLVYFKNVPRKYLRTIGIRLLLAQILFVARAIMRGQGWYALKGSLMAGYLILTKMGERRRIQRSKQVSDSYIWSVISHDLPPNAHALRRLRAYYHKLARKV